MPYLDLLRPVAEPAPLINGLSVLGLESERKAGRTMIHPWRGRVVDCPRGRGRLIWTDGFRAAVAPRPNLAWFVDLASLRLIPAKHGGDS